MNEHTEMVAELKRRILRVTRSAIGKNILSLYAMQFANYLLPLITIPYLLRTLGPEKFGVVEFGRSFITYFVLLINYGFDFSATREIAVNRDNLNVVGNITNSVIATKVFLGFIGIIIFGVFVFSVPKLNDNLLVLFILFGVVIGNVLFPTWLFQGMEKMTVIATINFIVRGMITIGIFIFINRSDDYLLYAALVSAQWILAGFLGIIWGYYLFKIKPTVVSWYDIKNQLSKGWVLFLSTGAVNFFTAGNAFILGLLTNSVTVGYYTAGEKLVKALQLLLVPVTQAVYPRFSKMASESTETVLYWARRGLLFQSGLGLVMSVFLFVSAPYIIDVLLGEEYIPSIGVIRILAVLPLLISLSSSMGQFILLPFKYDNVRLIMFVVAGIMNIVLALLLVPLFNVSGMALSVLCAEMFVTVSFYIFLKRHNLAPI